MQIVWKALCALTPALGQQKLYVLVFTTEKDLQQTTQLLDPAKAYAKGSW
ncbi:MalM family protein [Escherichia coli]